MRFGMAIDLKRCVGCHGCTIACKVENQTRPDVFWNHVEDTEFGKFPSVSRVFLPLLCMHCGNPPCVEVCPTGASYKRNDGIVLIDDDKCAGCKFCIEACPYGARYFNEDTGGYYGANLTPSERLGFQKQRVGVMGKCTFCVHRVDEGKEPICVRTCVGKARYFGDLDDPKSNLSQLIRQRRGVQLHQELGTDPSVYYLL